MALNTSVKAFFDQDTWTMTYVVFDPKTRDALIIDPVWDYDPASSKMTTRSVDLLLEWIRSKELRVHYVLETHAHADHVSGAQMVRERLPGVKVAIGQNIRDVQKVFKKIYNLEPGFPVDGSQFDLLLNEASDLSAGSLVVKTIFTPGHTPACASYLIGDAVFVGDAIFMPDYGTGRCDFPSGSAEDLYTSIHEKLFKLPDSTRVFVGHDYQPGGRELAFETTIGEQKAKNVQLKQSTSREDFVHFRTSRDKMLSAPRLLLPSIQINIHAGRLPKKEDNGTHYLKIPLWPQN